MAGSIYGKLFTVTTWGESHGKGLGVVIDGCPAGIALSEEDIQIYLDRRKPGQNEFTTKRNEGDKVSILSGVFEGKTTGTPISLVVMNEDQKSKDYGSIAESYRPGHADYCFDEKYGFRDYRGGGRSSGRETIGRVAAGAVAAKVLKELGITLTAYTRAIGTIKVADDAIDLNMVNQNPLYMPNNTCAADAAAYLNEMMEKKAAYIKFHPPKDDDTINILHFKDGKISRLEIIGENAERVFEALNMKRQTMSGVPCIITGEDPDILKSLGNLKHKLLDVSDESISEWYRQCYMPLQGEKYIS